MATARKTSTKPADNVVAVDETAATTADAVVEEVTEEIVEEAPAPAKVAKPQPLLDTDDIEVVSLIRNVDYLDKYSGDRYIWTEVGQPELMPFEVLKSMWRNNKTYFRSMWLRPNDDRVIKKFGLESIYKKYDYLMDGKNYTIDNIDEINETVANSPKDIKIAVRNKVKEMVDNSEIVDINVIRKLEKKFNMDLIRK